MQPISQAALILAALSLLTAASVRPAAAQTNATEAAQYRACLAKTETNADAAYDDALIWRVEFDINAITTGECAFLAARETQRARAVFEFHLILPSENGDNLASTAQTRVIQIVRNTSILAAQIKSFLDRPPTSWVE